MQEIASPSLVSWQILGDSVKLVYSDNDSFFVSKTDFDRAFGPIVSGSKENIFRDFSL